jgi:hypothetical protein
MTLSHARSWLVLACLASLGAPALARAQETVLLYDRHTQVVKHGPNGQVADVDTSSAEVLVILGEQRLVVREPDHECVYDFVRHRVRIVNSESMTFADWSLFGLVAFNDLELASRLNTPPKAPRPSVRQLEALFSMPASVKPSSKESLVDSSRGNSVDVWINGVPFTHATFSATSLPPAQRRTFERFLLYHFRLHPTARRALMRPGRVPATLSFRTLDANEETVVSWHLEKATTTPQVNDPTRGLARQDVVDKDFAELAGRLNHSREMNADTSRARRGAQSEAFEARALKEGKVLDAALARLSRDMEGCYTGSLAGWPAELRSKAAADSTFLVCLEASDTLSAARARRLLPRLMRIDPKSIARPDVIGLLVGRTQIASGDVDHGTSQLVQDLAKNPCATQAWMDLGQAYFQTYQPVLAWLCFDVAREVAPPDCRWLEPSARLEADLLKRRPEFFE